MTGLRTTDGGSRIVGVETADGLIETGRVLLTGGPSLRAVGALAGLRIPAGAARHSVAVLEPHEAFAVERMPMVFDIGDGLYWRLEEGGLLFGWSDPDEQPGEAREIDWAAYERSRRALGRLRAADARPRAAQDLGGDHRVHARPPADPRTGAAPDGSLIGGVTIASAAGHGMMWGPGVARVATDLVLNGRDRPGRCQRSRARPLRRRGAQPARDGPDRAAVPDDRRRLRARPVLPERGGDGSGGSGRPSPDRSRPRALGSAPRPAVAASTRSTSRAARRRSSRRRGAPSGGGRRSAG